MKVQMTTSMGDIVLELNPEKAPLTVESFITNVGNEHYDGTIFHRVIEDFMIQGGGLDGDMNVKAAGASVQNEAHNRLKNEPGTVAMARTADPHSATTQFFINTNDNAFLNYRSSDDDGWGYCVFGKVVEGMDVVEKIGATPTTTRNGYQDVPEDPIVIEKIVVL